MKTKVFGLFEFDIRNCPVWAIPQLARIRLLYGKDNSEIISAQFENGIGWVEFCIRGDGLYEIIIHKSQMNTSYVPKLIPIS